MNNEEKILEILKNMSAKIDKLDNDVDIIKTDVKRLQVENDGFKTDIKTIKIKAENIEYDVAEIKPQILTINSAVKAIFEDISRHDSRLEKHDRILKV